MKDRVGFLGLLAFLPIAVVAQSFNGSFEGNGAGDVSGWSGLCWPPTAEASNCPDGGSWGLLVESGHNLGCTNASVIHKAPWITDGEQVTLSGWCVHQFGTATPFIGFGLGTVNNGTYTYNTYPQSNFSGWHYFTFTQTMDLGPGDTAMVFLQPGSVNFPLVFCNVLFDELTLSSLATSINTATTTPSFRVDHAAALLHVAELTDVRSVHVMDATGRTVARPTFHPQDRQLVVDLSGMPSGVLLFRFDSAAGPRWIRTLLP